MPIGVCDVEPHERGTYLVPLIVLLFAFDVKKEVEYSLAMVRRIWYIYYINIYVRYTGIVPHFFL